MYSLRPATTLDAAAISQLVNRAYRPAAGQAGWTSERGLIDGERIQPEQVDALISDNSAVLLLCDHETVIGCVHVQQQGEVAYIGMLATDPTLQAQGLGKRLLQAAEDYAVSEFNTEIFRMSVLSQRPELLAFYQRRGYQVTGETYAFPVEENVGQPLQADIHIIALQKKRAGI